MRENNQFTRTGLFVKFKKADVVLCKVTLLPTKIPIKVDTCILPRVLKSLQSDPLTFYDRLLVSIFSLSYLTFYPRYLQSRLWQ